MKPLKNERYNYKIAGNRSFSKMNYANSITFLSTDFTHNFVTLIAGEKMKASLSLPDAVVRYISSAAGINRDAIL